MSGDPEQRLVLAIEALTPKEAHALRYFGRTNQASISADKASEFYELYLNGNDCEEIRRLNPGFSLGQIVHARVRDDWDLKREEHQQKLLVHAPPRVAQVQIESTQFLSDLLAASIKLHWDAIKKFLQDGNPTHLQGTPLSNGASLKQIRDIIDTLQAATGQDKRKVVEHRGGLTVSHTKRVSPDEAAQALEVLALDVKD
jgi:hypothetical protein